MKKMMAASVLTKNQCLLPVSCVFYLLYRVHSLADGLCIKEESGTRLRGVEEIGSGHGDPLEDGETGAAFEHEHGNDLLHEETNDNRRPLDSRAVLRRGPEEELEDEEASNRNGTVTVSTVLYGCQL
jgi:hypothetical protein